MSPASIVLGLIGSELVGPVVLELGNRAVRSLTQMPGTGETGGQSIFSSPFDPEPPNTARLRLALPGLRNSPRTAQVVEQQAQSLPGVSSARANLVTGRLLVLYDPAVTGPEAIATALRRSDGSPVPR
ncbi:MAG: cation transporter [Chloroflexi bacterium]|nr:cation transporter [Chloroflexota bacterium]